jgi:hypothetical protein
MNSSSTHFSSADCVSLQVRMFVSMVGIIDVAESGGGIVVARTGENRDYGEERGRGERESWYIYTV